MLKIAIWIAVVMAIVLLYALCRPLLRELPWLKPLYDRLEPVEAFLWDRSRTILLARLIWVPGTLLSLHDAILPAFGLVNWTPISASLLLQLGVPEQFHAAAVLMFTTLLTQGFEALRKVTTGPVEK